MATERDRITTAHGSGHGSGVGRAPDRRRWWALAVLAMALSLVVIDGSIVSVALPDIVPDLDMGISEAQWVNSIYAVVFSALLLPAGRLGDRLGRRTTLLIGVIVFVGASVLASQADAASSLIAARLVQGIGGAFILPSTLSTVNATFRGKDRCGIRGLGCRDGRCRCPRTAARRVAHVLLRLGVDLPGERPARGDRPARHCPGGTEHAWRGR
ncbi:MFS transporter [Propionibacteriaceae bacterium Y1700]|uniref:MFS transporter n=1 Tax=Microlunatus sp. Y1700 TaxID=3418487 RepID=UPI003DA744F2